MKTLNSEKTKTNFTEFALSNEEMINVRGGEGDTTIHIPPIKI
jgi:hypothetical protein